MAKIEKSLMLFKEIIEEKKISLPGDAAPAKPIRKLAKFFKTVEDARMSGKVRYPLHEILMTIFLAAMAGAGTMADIELFAKSNAGWLEKNFGVRHGIPSHDTFRRVLALVDPEQLQRATVSFLLENIECVKRAFGIGGGTKHYCVDGKTARGSGRLKDCEREIRQMHTLHVYDRSDGICLVSEEVGGKTNEIPVAQGVLRLLDLKNTVVSFDALNTQRDTVAAVVGQGGGYVAALKGNQPELHAEVESYFTPAVQKRIRDGKTNYVEVIEKLHGRVEVRRYYLSKNVSWLVQAGDWQGLKAVVYHTLQTENINSGKKTFEVSCYIASVTDAELCADIIRGHWAVENELHWHLDVNFLEDGIQIADRCAFRNFSLINKMALSLLKLVAPIQKVSVRSTRKLFGWNHGILMDAFRVLDEDLIAAALLDVKAKRQ